ncbi:MAG: hypothetical protein M3Z16_00180 [Pseudomonadota bacterium]|nr:hypothetical protein [Pseudomonadota bacterium]
MGIRLAVVTGATLLAACADFNSALSEPNSRTMSLATLDLSIRPGMTSDEVVVRIGRPTYRFPVGGQKQFVWNYRFAPPEGDCFVFQVSFADATARVVETGQGYDRTCDGNSRD